MHWFSAYLTIEEQLAFPTAAFEDLTLCGLIVLVRLLEYPIGT